MPEVSHITPDDKGGELSPIAGSVIVLAGNGMPAAAFREENRAQPSGGGRCRGRVWHVSHRCDCGMPCVRPRQATSASGRLSTSGLVSAWVGPMTHRRWNAPSHDGAHLGLGRGQRAGPRAAALGGGHPSAEVLLVQTTLTYRLKVG